MFRPSYDSGYAPRDFVPEYPELWDGVVGAWCPSLGATGGTLFDQSGNNNHGTLSAGINLGNAWANPAVNGLVLNGYSASAQSIQFNKQIALGATLTEIVWVILDPATTTTWRTILQSTDDDSLQLRNQTVSSLYWHGLAFLKTVPFNTLCQIVITRNSSNLVKLFFNGVYTGESGTKATTETLIGISNTSASFDWQGSIVDVCVWNRTLSDSEILRLYEIGPGGIYTPSSRQSRLIPNISATGNRRRRVIIGAA